MCSGFRLKTKKITLSFSNLKCGADSKSSRSVVSLSYLSSTYKEQEAVCDRPFLAEVSVWEHQRGHQGPEIDSQAQPAGADLHPHGRHGGLHGLVVGVWPDEPRAKSEKNQCCNIVCLYEGVSHERREEILTCTSW